MFEITGFSSRMKIMSYHHSYHLLDLFLHPSHDSSTRHAKSLIFGNRKRQTILNLAAERPPMASCVAPGISALAEPSNTRQNATMPTPPTESH
jgi:hypothetical protein